MVTTLIDLLGLFWPTLLVAAAASVSGGVLGVIVLLRRQAMLALALPQVAGLGAAVGLRFLSPLTLPPILDPVAQTFGWPTLPAAAGCVLLAVLLLAVTRQGNQAILVPSVYLAGLCLAVLVVARSGAHLAEVQAMLTGVDVATDPATAFLASPLLLLGGLAVGLSWRRWVLLEQAPTLAEIAGVSASRWQLLLWSALGAYCLLATHAVGAVLPLVLLLIPPAIVLPFSARIPPAMAASAALGVVILAGGFWLSVGLAWPLSQSVGAVGLVGLAFSTCFRALRTR